MNDANSTRAAPAAADLAAALRGSDRPAPEVELDREVIALLSDAQLREVLVTVPARGSA